MQSKYKTILGVGILISSITLSSVALYHILANKSDNSKRKNSIKSIDNIMADKLDLTDDLTSAFGDVPYVSREA